MPRLFRFIVYLMMPILMSCAATEVNQQAHGHYEGLEIFIDGPRDSLATFQLMRSGAEVWLKGPVKRPETEGKAPRTLYSDDVDPSLSLIARAYQSDAISLAAVSGFNDAYARAKAAHPAAETYVTFVEIEKNVFKLNGGKYGPLIFNLPHGWISRVPVSDSFHAVVAFNSIENDIAYADCGDYPKEDNSCTVSAFGIETRLTEQLTEVAGNVEDMKFSCDGKSLYILTRQFSVKSGPIDSLFALAGHPNSDNWYHLIMFSMSDRKEVTIEVEGEYPPGHGYLVANCDERQDQEKRG